MKQLRDYERTAATGPPDYYRTEPVRWLYDLDTKKWEPLGTPEAPVELMVPAVRRTNAGTAMFLADTAEYALGVGEADRSDKAAKYHKLFVDLATAGATAGVPGAAALVSHLTEKAIKPPPGVTPQDRVVFRWRGVVLTDRAEARAFWATHQTARFVDGPVLPCSCCGERRATVKLVTDAIAGVPKSLQGQCVLLTANNDSAERYGRVKCYGAGLCFPCVRDATRAINRLMGSDQAVFLGRVVVLVWGAAVPLVEVLTAPTVETAALLRAAPWEAGQQTHVLVLMARQSRAVVLAFDSFDAGELGDRLATWVETQGDPHGLLDAAYPGPDETVPPVRKTGLLRLLHPAGDVSKLEPGVVADVVSAVVSGTPLPGVARAAAQYLVGRGPAPDGDREGAAAAALARLTARYHPEGDMTGKMPVADTPAYRCGLLLGQLERLQKAAVPNIERTVADNALRTAKTNPPAVLGDAMTTARAHLAKLEKLNRAGPFRDAINECVTGLEIPPRFTASEQAAFCLGYYAVSMARAAAKPD